MMRFARFAFLAAVLAAATLHTDGAWAQKTLEELQKDMNGATSNVDGATKDAKDTMPAKAAKDTEDALDAAVRKNADTPASNKTEKAKTEKAEKDAQDAADATAKNDANAKPYRAALQKRRAARNNLRSVCAQIANIVQRRRRGAGVEAVKEAEEVYKKCLETLNGSEKIISAALFDDGPAPGLQPGQEYVSRPRQQDDSFPPVCDSANCSLAPDRRNDGRVDQPYGGVPDDRIGPNTPVPIVPNAPGGSRRF